MAAVERCVTRPVRWHPTTTYWLNTLHSATPAVKSLSLKARALLQFQTSSGLFSNVVYQCHHFHKISISVIVSFSSWRPFVSSLPPPLPTPAFPVSSTVTSRGGVPRTQKLRFLLLRTQFYQLFSFQTSSRRSKCCFGLMPGILPIKFRLSDLLNCIFLLNPFQSSNGVCCKSDTSLFRSFDVMNRVSPC